MTALRMRRVLSVFVVGMMLSAGSAQAGVLTNLGFGSDGLDIDTARLPNSGDYCSDPLGINRPCFSDKTLPFTGHGVIEHISLTATLSNTFSLGELSLYLSHAGVTVHLFDNHGVNSPVTITFDDLAANPLQFNFGSGTFRPDSPLSAFNGLEASGDWTLTVGDWDTGDISRYTGAVLAVTTPEPATLVLLAFGLAGLGVLRRRSRLAGFVCLAIIGIALFGYTVAVSAAPVTELEVGGTATNNTIATAQTIPVASALGGARV